MLFALALTYRIERAECTGVRRSGDQYVSLARMPIEEVRDQLPAAITHPASVEANETFDRKIWDATAHALKGTRDAALHQQTCFRQVESEHPFHLAIP